ncbi:MAG: amino acid adenylation domain-containing protein [Micromonosporaceae bacterium]|nr:amino acid adenylation domain-containing protein [Micromonosporaceae bacterium]
MTVEPEPIAVIGSACRFPASADVQGFWELLRQGREAVTVPSDEELLAAGVTADDLADADYVRAALLTPGVDTFDAEFFGMSAAAADACDPQLRMFLETAHSAVEDAGHDLTAIGDGAAVFGAARPGRYRELHLPTDAFEAAEHARAEPDLAAFTSSRLDLRGPSVTVGSCSLLAVHLATQSLIAGDCDVALAGGVHVELPYGHGYRWTPGARLPPDGHSRPFDAAAAGSVPGTGAGVLVLKRLGEAIADGDCVRAVIRASAAGHPGAGGGWASAIAGAIAFAGCDPQDFGYVEADGAATGPVDAREVDALARGFRLAGAADPPPGSVPIGSVKSNVGHLAAAAGVAGLLKTVLALQHEHLPATLNVATPHPGLNLAATPFRVATDPSPWPLTAGSPRRAAVHAVGPGGANTLLVVDDAADGVRPEPVGASARPRIVVWSGRQPAAADAAAAALARYFATADPSRFADAAATLRQGRTAHLVRRAAVCASAAEAAAALSAPGVIAADHPAPRQAEVVFSFPDLVAGQRVPIGLYGTQPAFTEAADLCLEAFERRGVDLYERWIAGRATGDAAAELVFTAEYALAVAWRSWGVRPAAVLGAGVGEIAAAVVAEALDLDTAARLLTQGQRAAAGAVLSPPEVPIGSVADGRLRLELGPGPAATSDEDERHLLTTLARLWASGAPVDWERLEPDHPLQRVPLPGYPYRRRRHWVVPARGPAAPSAPDRQPDSAPPAKLTSAATIEGLPPAAEPPRPLGRTEHAFWVLDQLAPDSGVSNIGVAFRPARPLRWWPLQTAVNQLLRRHPALRLRFPEIDGTPVRHLTAGADAELPIQTRTTTPEQLIPDLQEFLHRPFDLHRDFLFRAGHFSLPDGGSVVCLAAHHIVIDAASVQILVEELGQIYDGITASGRIPDQLATVAPLLAEPEPSPEAIRYWLDHLRGAQPEAMVLPGSHPAPARPTFAGHTCSWQMAEPAQQAMRALRRELRTTDNLVLMSAFCLTLLRHGAGPDLVIGVPVGTRRPATENHVGYGVSTLPLRIRVDPRAGFRDLAHRVGEAFLNGVEHADATVERVITERGHGTTGWRVPLFRHMFNYRPWSDEKIRICGEVPEYLEDLFDRSRLDLQCIAVPEPDRLTLRCWHSTEVHHEAEIEAFVARMQALLERAAAEPDRPVSSLPFGSTADQAAWQRVNHTRRRWGTPSTVPERIAAQAQATPAATAVVDGEQASSYQDLIYRAIAVRDLLRDRGVQPGQVVALALGRSAGAAAAVLGTWAAGACYLPLDPDQPEARLAYQVDDAAAALVLTDIPEHPDRTAPGQLLDGAAPDPDSPAYVSYTSGSTGAPKGVVVSHRSLLNLVCGFTELLPSGAAGAVLWSTTTTFDISALELLLPLVNGGRAVVAPDQASLRPRALLDLVREHDVSTVQATPTAWRMLLPEADGELAGRTLLCGGEPMSAALARQLRRHGGRLFNVYGPTETTIWSTAAELDHDPEDPVPVGAPIANTRVFVTDPDGQELPPGVPGELCLAGDGVSTGYLRRAELTAARFGEHPRYGRFYRTGDVARLRYDGGLELFGRHDRQVKLRGHRIELGEVEGVLHEHPDVALAAVRLDGDPQTDGRLVAFVEPRSGGQDPGRLREEVWRHARDRLPGAAVPSGIVVLDRLPTTPNGKIDHRALPAVDPDPDPTWPVEPEPAAGDPELTEALTRLWREALRRPRLGEHDNFFLNGGHSILAARLVGRIAEVTGRPAPVSVVFAYPTPAELAAHLSPQQQPGGDP